MPDDGIILKQGAYLGVPLAQCISMVQVQTHSLYRTGIELP